MISSDNAATYDTSSPVLESPWLSAQGIASFSDVKFLENFLGGTGTFRYQYATNAGNYNGTWLTYSELRSALSSVIVITNPDYALRLKAQFISNGAQSCEYIPDYIVTSGFSGNTITQVIRETVDSYSSRAIVGKPAIIFMDNEYESGTTVSVTPNDTVTNYSATDILYATEDTGYKGTTAGTKIFKISMPNAITMNALAMLGENLVGCVASLAVSNDDVTYANVVENYTIGSEALVSTWVPFTAGPYKYAKLTLTNFNTNAFLRHVCLGKQHIPCYLKKYDPDGFKLSMKNIVSEAGRYLGSRIKSRKRTPNIDFARPTETEYAQIKAWRDNCLVNGRPFFFAPDSTDVFCMFLWPVDDFDYSAPLERGMRTLGKMNFDARI